MINWTSAAETESNQWESEPNNGGGAFNIFPGSGKILRAHANVQGDIDEYKFTVTTAHDVIIKLTAKKEAASPWSWDWADQTNGYYPVAVWYNGSNLATNTMQARTNTAIFYVNHTGTGEANYAWDYSHFHPADANDWLGNWGSSDELIPNTKGFGNDYNTYNSTVQSRLNAWGVWMIDQIGFDGFRLDFVRGFQVPFITSWINNLPKNGTQQRFIVGEYWGNASRIKEWVNNCAAGGSDVDGFDFPLKSSLTDMCNGNGTSFNMTWLNNAGMIRNNSGNSLPGTSIVTFLENHDTGKEHDKWVSKDWQLGYAYMLTHEGRPCIFYPHFYNALQTDAHNSAYTTCAPASLKNDMKKLIFARKTYLDGGLVVLSQDGNPYPASATSNVYIARRGGNATTSGAIIVLNNHDSQTMGLWVNSSPTGWASWANTVLVNAFDTTQTATVQADGRVFLSAPARGYAIYVKQSERVSYVMAKSATVQTQTTGFENTATEAGNIAIYPNPVEELAKISFKLDASSQVSVNVYNPNGQLVSKVFEGNLASGLHSYEWKANQVVSGIYVCQIKYGDKMITQKLLVQ
jgi:alpha-amylase